MADDQKSFLYFTPGDEGKELVKILTPLKVKNEIKAQAYAEYFNSKDERDFTTRFKSLEGFPNEMKAQLYAHKYGQQRHPSSMLTPEGMGELVTTELPAIGGTVGALGGLPGIALGAGAGTAARQLIRAHKGEQVPTTVGGSLAEMGTEAAKQAAYEYVPKVVVGGLGRAARSIAKPLYKSTLSFTGLDDLPARRAATEAGIRLGVPTSEKAGLPKAEEFIQRMTAQVDAEVAKAKAAGKMVDTRTIMAPVEEQVREYAKSLAPTEPEKAALAIRNDILKRLGAKEETIRIDTSGEYSPPLEAPHIVKKPPPKFKEVKVMQPPPRFMDPEEALVAKRATSRTLRKAYGEEKGPGIETLKAGERGAKEALEDIAAVKNPNWQEHVAITLKDAIERTIKSKPGWLKTAIPELVGAGALLSIGHTGYAEALAVGGIIRQALQKPEVMSRLAIILDREGTRIPKFAEPAVKYGLRFGRPLTKEMPPSRVRPNPNGQ